MFFYVSTCIFCFVCARSFWREVWELVKFDFFVGLHLIMHRTIGLTGYIGPLTRTLTIVC